MLVQLKKDVSGRPNFFHGDQPLILPSDYCLFCNIKDSAAFGFGGCPVCRGASALDGLEKKVDDLEDEIEGANIEVKNLEEQLSTLQGLLEGETPLRKHLELTLEGKQFLDALQPVV